uniref:Uncharacterized protein n=1 Tax=Lepeophtheirus salmonis TaxID=72036 RepID=A0A0K2TCK6_LEPSM
MLSDYAKMQMKISLNPTSLFSHDVTSCLIYHDSNTATDIISSHSFLKLKLGVTLDVFNII